MKLREATPIKFTRGTSFVTRERGCSMEDVRVPSYNISVEARGLSELRKQLGLSLRDAASKVGVSAVEFAKLERGQLVPVGGRGEWMAMADLLKKTGARE